MTADECTQIANAMGTDGGWDQWEEHHGEGGCSLTAGWTGGDPLTAARVLAGRLGLEVQAKDLGHGVVVFT